MRYIKMNPEVQQKVKKLYDYYVSEKGYEARNKLKIPFIILFHIGSILWLIIVTMIMTLWNGFHLIIAFVFNIYEYEDPSPANRDLINRAATQTNNQLTRICYLISLIICDTRYIFTRNKYDKFLIHFLEYFNSEQMQEFLPGRENFSK